MNIENEFKKYKHDMLSKVSSDNVKYKKVNILMPTVWGLMLFKQDAIGSELEEVNECLDRLKRVISDECQSNLDIAW